MSFLKIHKKPPPIILRPQAKQWKFMSCGHYEVLYGGSAGGGKSVSIIMEAARQCKIGHYKALILRKTYKELQELVDLAQMYYPRAFPGAYFNESKMVFIFPSGARIFFGSMQYEKDKLKYQGKAYDVIIFDELTHFTWDEYSYMFSRNRPTAPGTICYMRATTNPGGKGHIWVKDRWRIGDLPPETDIWDKYDIVTPQGKVIQQVKSRIFIPATVFDNKLLLQNDPMYLSSLAMLPESERQALLYGDWESFSGQVFGEWKNDPKLYETHKFTHVIEPFKIPDHWRRFRSFDFGYSKPFSVGWWAMNPDTGILYRYRELYGCTDKPNTGVKWTPHEIARKIVEIEREREPEDVYIQGFADPSIWDKSRGESVAEMMESCGVFWDKADNNRMAGKMQMHYRMAFDTEGVPMMYVFKTCKDFIRTVPGLTYSQTDVEDVDTDQEDHIYDEARYMVIMNPIVPRMNLLTDDIPKTYNPLDIPDEMGLQRYGFIRM